MSCFPSACRSGYSERLQGCSGGVVVGMLVLVRMASVPSIPTGMPRENTTFEKPQLSFCSRQQRLRRISSVPSPVPGPDGCSSVYGFIGIEYRQLVGSLLKHYIYQSTIVLITQRTNRHD